MVPEWRTQYVQYKVHTIYISIPANTTDDPFSCSLERNALRPRPQSYASPPLPLPYPRSAKPSRLLPRTPRSATPPTNWW